MCTTVDRAIADRRRHVETVRYVGPTGQRRDEVGGAVVLAACVGYGTLFSLRRTVRCCCWV